MNEPIYDILHDVSQKAFTSLICINDLEQDCGISSALAMEILVLTVLH